MKDRLTLFENAIVHTVDDSHPRARWFTVLGDRFQRVGSGPPPEVKNRVDLQKKCIVPGFVDSHIHFYQTGLDLRFIDLSDTTCIDQMAATLHSEVKGKRSWIFAHSFEEDRLSDTERVTRHDLDRLYPDRPVWINRVDYHSAVVNSVALRHLEIPGGMRGLMCDGNTPNGILRADAYLFGKAAAAKRYPMETKDKAVRAAAERCVSRGITAVHALEGGALFGDEGVAMMLRKMESIPLDVTIFLQEKSVYFSTKLGFEHLGGCILIDGSIGSYTAALYEDYRDSPGVRGLMYEKSRPFFAFVEEAHATGVQLAFHAIGPRAIDLVLEAYARALHKVPSYDRRHRIEHFELATDEQISRAVDLGVVVAMQPAFEYMWGGPKGMYANRLGPAWRQTNRLRTILEAGVPIAGGSDANVTPPDPLLGMHAAVNHPNDEQRIDAKQALRMMTLDAAYAAFNERRHGSIVPGKEASFVVLSDDPLRIAKRRIRDIEVEETWYRGKRVFQNAAHAS